MSLSDSSRPKPSRSPWIQFRIASLLGLLGIASVFLAYYFSPAKRAERASAKLRDAGADVYYDFQRQASSDDNPSYSTSVAPPGPSVVRKVVGEGFFQDAEKIILNDKSLSISDVRSLYDLPSVRRLSMNNCELGDEHVRALRGLPRLESFMAKSNAITDVGVAYLSELRNLTYISLSRNSISGTGFKDFSSPKLVELFLYDNPISDEGMSGIARLTSLKQLGLSRTAVTDKGISHLANLTSLEYISLNKLDITDEALFTLQKLPALKRIELHGTKVTQDGIAALKAVLPGCEVSH